MERIWERQDGESEKAFNAFKIYIELGSERGCQQVASRLSISRQSVQKWYNRFDWKNRARAYDSSILEEARTQKKKLYQKYLNRQFEVEMKLQEKIAAALTAKDLSKASFKSLNEMQNANFARMNELAAKLKLDEVVEDNELVIKFVDV